MELEGGRRRKKSFERYEGKEILEGKGRREGWRERKERGREGGIN